VDVQRETLRSLFNAAADSYDQVGVDFFQPIAAGLVAELDPQPGERALDLGCGRGAALFPIARAVGPTGFAVGGDLSPVMVAHTTALAAEEGLNQVEVLVMDAQEPDLAEVAEDGFDLLSASMVLFFLPDPLEALARWRELARPGGRVGVATFGPPDPTWKSIDDLFQPYLPPQLLDARTSGAAGPFGSAAGVEGLFTTAGWSDPVSADVALAVRFDGADRWYRFSMSVGQRGFWGIVPEDKRAGIRKAAAGIIEDAAGPDGSVTFTQGIRYTLARNG
jgi:ubiquinone/menaquinone biosynthesis C-methylase UbiE